MKVHPIAAMAGLDPAINGRRRGADARIKSGHDVERGGR